ncbi:MAG: putative 2-aminoethylphosphonate ABC transporter permease subunit [Rhodospirillaceae bacterium]|nr:putative 2-aminoethylphosphonate ABC transporter permease subunit [Rhodospirillaceae bacterium]
MAVTTGGPAAMVRARVGREGWIMRIALILLGIYLVVTVLLPLESLLRKSFFDKEGVFVGVSNYLRYFTDPALSVAITNSLTVTAIATSITIVIAFIYAYAIQRSQMWGRGIFRGIALVPLLAPSLLPGLSLVYMFGNQGFLNWMLGGHSIYGPIGIVIGEVFFTLPHAVMIILTALATADQRLYEAAESLRASKLRIFFTVTLPGARYGLISAIFVVFTLNFTDFGVPKVIGGSYNVLATDIYKQVIGQFNFQMGAVVGMLLLIPAVISFIVDRTVQKKQVALLSARAVPYQPKSNGLRDIGLFLFCSLVAIFVVGILVVAAYGSFITYWPYDLTFTWKNYDFNNIDTNGWGAYFNSLKMAALTAIIGTAIIFWGAYLIEKGRGFGKMRGAIQFLCMVPLAVPGLVLGLSYIFFFNHPANPLNFLYLTMAILVINTIAHFYTVCHLTALTALKQMDAEFESVSASLKIPFYKTFWRVTVPVCLPAIIDIAIYLFVNAMTTVSAVVFLYSSNTKLASISVLNMDDAGNTASAAAMGMTIVATSAAVRIAQGLLTHGISRRTQAWRRR